MTRTLVATPDPEPQYPGGRLVTFAAGWNSAGTVTVTTWSAATVSVSTQQWTGRTG